MLVKVCFSSQPRSWGSNDDVWSLRQMTPANTGYIMSYTVYIGGCTPSDTATLKATAKNSGSFFTTHVVLGITPLQRQFFFGSTLCHSSHRFARLPFTAEWVVEHRKAGSGWSGLTELAKNENNVLNPGLMSTPYFLGWFLSYPRKVMRLAWQWNMNRYEYLTSMGSEFVHWRPNISCIGDLWISGIGRWVYIFVFWPRNLRKMNAILTNHIV